jgi:hypothetical protein
MPLTSTIVLSVEHGRHDGLHKAPVLQLTTCITWPKHARRDPSDANGISEAGPHAPVVAFPHSELRRACRCMWLMARLACIEIDVSTEQTSSWTWKSRTRRKKSERGATLGYILQEVATNFNGDIGHAEVRLELIHKANTLVGEAAIEQRVPGSGRMNRAIVVIADRTSMKRIAWTYCSRALEPPLVTSTYRQNLLRTHYAGLPWTADTKRRTRYSRGFAIRYSRLALYGGLTSRTAEDTVTKPVRCMCAYAVLVDFGCRSGLALCRQRRQRPSVSPDNSLIVGESLCHQYSMMLFVRCLVKVRYMSNRRGGSGGRLRPRC